MATHIRARAAGSPRQIPWWVKGVYTAFVCVLVPYYWTTYTPWNFLYFCDLALLITCVALWLESPFLTSTQAVGIVLPQMLWVADFGARLVSGVHLTGMTAYMFDPAIPLFVRGLSSFHGWLPFLLLWLVVRLGYDRRAFAAQTVLGLTVLLVCYFVAPAPPAPAGHPNAAVNINYVFGLNDGHAQAWMRPEAWLSLLMAFAVIGLYLPAHLFFRKFAVRERGETPRNARPSALEADVNAKLAVLGIIEGTERR